MAEITKTPRKYGFHATLKPPFRLAGHPDDLDKALRALAGGLAPVSLQGLELARLSDFLALRPIGPTKGLNALAARLVRDLDHLRAPLTPAEYARRRPESLSPRQRGYLESWGYPYVLDEFRFHMTLTGPLTGPQLDRTEAILRPALAPMLSGPCVIRDICLFGEAEDGFFHLMKRYPLGRAAPSC